MIRKEKYLSNILQQLEDFLKTDWPHNTWIENTAIRVYVRQSERYVSPSLDTALTCLDIANISVAAPYRQQGLFTDFVTSAHEMHPFEMTYLECILNPILIQWCVKRGWTAHGTHPKNPANCFYVLKHGKNSTRVAP